MLPNGITVIRDENYFQKHFNRDSKLSLKGKGLLSLVFSLPPSWDFSLRGLAKICKEDKDTIGRIIKELETSGYCHKEQVRELGKFKGYHYFFRETVVTPYPHFGDSVVTVSEKTVSGKTVSGKWGHNIKGIDIIDNNNNKEGGENPPQDKPVNEGARPQTKNPLPPSCQIWLKLMEIDLPETGVKLISSRVTNLTCWTQTLEGWLASGWSKNNIDGQLNRYSKKLREGDFTEETVEPEKTKEETQEDKDLRRLIYGN